MTQDQSGDNQLQTNEDEFKLWNPLYMIGGAGVVAAVASVYLVVSKSRKKQ